MQKKFARRISLIVAIILLVVILFKVINIQEIVLKKIYKQQYSEYVNKYAEIYNMDPLWIYAIIKVESNFNKDATSNSGAKGLMQLMDTTAEEMAKKDGIENFTSDMLFDPETNIRLGTKYFDELLAKYNENYYLAIAAYNGGIGNVDNWINQGIISSDASDIENIPYKETNMYVRKTVNAYKVYVELYAQLGTRPNCAFCTAGTRPQLYSVT